MLRISYRIRLNYPLYVILAQYYDYEHIRTVHPTTLGEYRLVESSRGAEEIVYDHLWPAGRGGKRAVSRVRHRFLPPLSMEFEFIGGRHRGARVVTRLAPDGEGATLVDEEYFIPRLPNWRWLARALKPWVMAPVNRIWREDLDVGVCIDGWPGVPAAALAGVKRAEAKYVHPAFPDSIAAADVPEGEVRGFMNDGRAVAVARVDGRLYALEDRCPHAGGPLSRGKISSDKKCLTCPWHGAKFDLATGALASGPGEGGVAVVEVPGVRPGNGR